MLVEAPILVRPTLAAERACIACAHCCRPAGSLSQQLAVVSGTPKAKVATAGAELPELPPLNQLRSAGVTPRSAVHRPYGKSTHRMRWCDCGAAFCCAACYDAGALAHSLLCTVAAARALAARDDEGAAHEPPRLPIGHPLREFRQLASSVSETLLLAASAMAREIGAALHAARLADSEEYPAEYPERDGPARAAACAARLRAACDPAPGDCDAAARAELPNMGGVAELADDAWALL